MAVLPRRNKRDFTSVFMNIKEFIGSAQNAHIRSCMLGTTTFEPNRALMHTLIL
jgi:hypothetical protein